MSKAYEGDTCAKFMLVAQFAVGFLPYYWRFIQVVRRYINDPAKDKMNLLNAIKYILSIATFFCGTMASSFREDRVLFNTWLGFATITSLASWVWDVYQDWGLV